MLMAMTAIRAGLFRWPSIKWARTPVQHLPKTLQRRHPSHRVLHPMLDRSGWPGSRICRATSLGGNTDSDSWSAATVNLPLRQGAQIWVTNGGRAEIQFDDGSFLRLGNGSVAILQSLYSDADGEFTEIKLNEGLSSLTLRHGNSIYQVDTPFASVKSDGPSTVRVGVDNTVEIAVRSGRATVQGASGDVARRAATIWI